MITSFDNGNLVIYDENIKEWIYPNGEICNEVNLRICPKCGQLPTKEGHDFCLANLPGVKNACCGHGVQEGYIQFENGITIKGYFRVESSENINKQKYGISFYDENQTHNLIFSKDTWKKIVDSIKPYIKESEQ